MGKKLDVREYQCELIRVLDGDTIDCYIDLGFNLKVKKHGGKRADKDGAAVLRAE